MGSFTPVPNLNGIVARMVAPHVRDIAKRVELDARKLAPGIKTWVSMGDNRVRDTHVEANGQEVPTNARFTVTGQPWDIAHGLSPGIDYLLHPKDTSTGLPLDSVQHVHCRCITALSPAAIAATISTGPAEIYGNLVRVVVTCTHVQVMVAEYGDTYGEGVVAEGTHFMGRAAARAAATGGYAPADATPDGVGVGRTGGEDN